MDLDHLHVRGVPVSTGRAWSPVRHVENPSATEALDHMRTQIGVGDMPSSLAGADTTRVGGQNAARRAGERNGRHGQLV